MDEYSGKKAVGGVVIPRKGSGLVLRDRPESRDKDAQFCNRLGCNGRLNHTKSVLNGCSEKFKSSRPSFRASNVKEIGIPSRNCPSVITTNTRKTLREPRKKVAAQLVTEDSTETSSSVQDESEVSELIPAHGTIQTVLESEPNHAESGKVRLVEVGSSTITASNIRPQKVFLQKSGGLGARDALLGSSVSLASKSSCQEGARNSGIASRYGLRNLRCNSISDVVPSGCSASESHLIRRKDVVKKRNPEVESSLSGRGVKKISGPLLEEESGSGRGKKVSGPLSEDSHHSSTSTNNGISISDSRRARNCPPIRDNGVQSVRTRRLINGNTNRTRLCNRGNGNDSAPMELPIVTSQLPKPEITIGLDVPSLPHQFSAEASSSHSTSYSHPGSSSGGGSVPSIMPINPPEHGIARSLINCDGLRRYNMDGIAGVLLALERIEQDEELTYEQLLSLESNLFLGGLGFYDQHRDMRLDIDNMSYEELLALEEKMGIVSTALSEEALSKCLKRSIYQPTLPMEGFMGCHGDKDEIKCSICQEEYLIGDEVGSLECEHGYHVECICQWLRLKNWCPTCKASAVPSPQSSSPSSLVDICQKNNGGV